MNPVAEAAMTEDPGVRGRVPLRGRGLRFVLVNELANHGTLTVAEMVVIVGRYGFDLDGRESKIISDALRWEVARGRVVKLARGVYGYGKVAVSTARRIRIFARVAVEWIVAPSRTITPQATPSPPYDGSPGRHPDPERPPWWNFAWLWNT